MIQNFFLILIVCLSMASSFRHNHPRFITSKSKKAGPLSDAPVKDIAAEKLVYDSDNNRFYESDLDKVSSNPVDEFFLTDKETGNPIYLTREEKERIFLDSIQSYYYTGKSQNKLSDDEFNRIRNDLTWEGSLLVTLNRNETLFVNAVQAYNKDKPILTNEQFDELKQFLKESNSKIAVSSEPKCYLDTGVCKVTWAPDTIRTTSLYVPATTIISLLYLGISYEVLAFLSLNLNPLLALLIGLAPISTISKAITENIFFKDPFVASGVCPTCGVENRVFFGDVFGVQGDRDEASVKCTNCKCGLTVKRSTLRVSTLLSKNKGGPPAPSQKADSDDE